MQITNRLYEHLHLGFEAKWNFQLRRDSLVIAKSLSSKTRDCFVTNFLD